MAFIEFPKVTFEGLFRTLGPRVLLMAFGAILLCLSGLITYQGGPFGWLRTLIIFVLAGCGLLLIILGIIKGPNPPPPYDAACARLKGWGMIDLRKFRGTKEMGLLLSECKKRVIILKTWFPEDKDIAEGLEKAVASPETTVQMILCHPEAAVLDMRSKGAGLDHKDEAADCIRQGLEMVRKTTNEKKFKGVGLYNAWPGCPVIWADDQVFMGFYFRGHPSPRQPWVEVRTGTQLSETLDRQRDELWDRSDRLLSLDELREWLADPKAPPKAEGWS